MLKLDMGFAQALVHTVHSTRAFGTRAMNCMHLCLCKTHSRDCPHAEIRHSRDAPRGGAAALPDFGRSEGAAGQRRRAALLPAPQILTLGASLHSISGPKICGL